MVFTSPASQTVVLAFHYIFLYCADSFLSLSISFFSHMHAHMYTHAHIFTHIVHIAKWPSGKPQDCMVQIPPLSS